VGKLVESGVAGKRLFALVLMESQSALASLDIVVDMIENSLSAFEQYRALKVAMRMVPTLSAKERDCLRVVLEQQRHRYITAGSDRYALSLDIERAMNAIESASK
jgi:hypothetical protein